jgi:hypothetical protein
MNGYLRLCNKSLQKRQIQYDPKVFFNKINMGVSKNENFIRISKIYRQGLRKCLGKQNEWQHATKPLTSLE